MQGELQEEGRRSGELVFKDDKFVLQDERSSGVGQGWWLYSRVDVHNNPGLCNFKMAQWGTLFVCIGLAKKLFGFFSPTPSHHYSL